MLKRIINKKCNYHILSNNLKLVPQECLAQQVIIVVKFSELLNSEKFEKHK